VLEPSLLPASARAAMPWRNGGGVTREIAAWPQGASMDTFGWRVSMAEVASTGPFSCFAGIDRVLTVLEGTLRLEVPGELSRRLDAAAPPYAFPGDAACAGGPESDPVVDLNVMVRRGHFRCSVQRVASGRFSVQGETCMFVAQHPATATIATTQWRLARHDALLLQDAGNAELHIEGAGVLITIWQIPA
jgi:environmental stress-induced protein Ves